MRTRTAEHKKSRKSQRTRKIPRKRMGVRSNTTEPKSNSEATKLTLVQNFDSETFILLRHLLSKDLK